MVEERHDQHYLRRPGNVAVRRSRWRRGLLRRVLLLAGQVLLIVGLYFVGRQAYLAAITSPQFDVKTIAVRGNKRAKTADLVALAGSALSTNIFRLDLEKLRADICSHSWVLDAAVRRSLPSTIEVTVTERAPAAIAAFEGRSYLVDGTGRILGEYGPDLAGYDFPVLTGLERLPRAEASSRIRTGATAVAALAAARPDFARRISEIDLASPDRLALHPCDGSPVLFVANDDPLRNLDQYAGIRNLIPRTLPAAGGDQPVRISYVDLRFRGRIAVMPQTQSTLESRTH